MASVTCAKCGQVWIRAEDVGFCAKCGAVLEVSTVQINEQPVAAQPKVTPKKKVTIQVWPVIALVSALVLVTVIFSLADEDFNHGVKETFGVDIAALSKMHRELSPIQPMSSNLVLIMLHNCAM